MRVGEQSVPARPEGRGFRPCFKRRLVLIPAAFVVVGLGGAGALVAWRILAPFYTAEGILAVEPGKPPPPTAPTPKASVPTLVPQGIRPTRIGTGPFGTRTRAASGDSPLEVYERHVADRVEALRSQRILAAALKGLSGRQAPYVGPDAALRLRKHLVVEHRRATRSIAVRLTGRDAAQVADIVRAVLERFLEHVEAEHRGADAERLAGLVKQRDALRVRLGEMADRLARLREKAGVAILGGEDSLHEVRLETLTRQLAVARTETGALHAAWVRSQSVKEEGDLRQLLADYPDAGKVLDKDPTVQRLGREVVRLSGELEQLRERYGPKHEAVRPAEEALADARRDLLVKQAEEAGLFFKSRYERARAVEGEMERKVAETRARAAEVAARADEYRECREECEGLEARLDEVMARYERARVESVLARPAIRVVRWPTVPVEPSQPKLLFYVPAVVILSVPFGACLALIAALVGMRRVRP